MSMPLHGLNKAFFDALLEGNAVTLARQAARLDMRAEFDPDWIHAMDGPTLASEKTADWFCMAYPMTEASVAALGAALDQLPTTDANYAGFRNLKLVDEAGHITDRGRWKWIASLRTLKEQAETLEIALREVRDAAADIEERAPRLRGPGGRSSASEQRVFAHWFADGWLGIHDEGFAFSLTAKLLWLAQRKSVQGLVPPHRPGMDREGRHFCEVLSFHSFYPVIGNKLVAVPDGARAVLVDIIKRATLESLAAGYEVYKKEFSSNWSKPIPFEIASCQLVLEHMGPERLAFIVDLMLSDERLIGGWPDLTLFKGGQVKLVEVKKRDRLAFHQVRAIDLIQRSMVPGVIAEVAIEQIR